MAYEKQTWVTGEVITKEKLNHMEDGIADAGTSSSQEVIEICGDVKGAIYMISSDAHFARINGGCGLDKPLIEIINGKKIKSFYATVAYYDAYSQKDRIAESHYCQVYALTSKQTINVVNFQYEENVKNATSLGVESYFSDNGLCNGNVPINSGFKLYAVCE